MPRCSILLLGLALAACNAPESFYSDLNGVLQVLPMTRTSYAIGDTLTLVGKLGGPHAAVKIQIGGASATIIAQVDSANFYGAPHGSDGKTPSGTTYNGSQDYVSVSIDTAMGLGIDRPVTVTLNGITRTAGLITITAAPVIAALPDTLNYADTAFTYNVSGGYIGTAMVARGDLGDGRVYLLAGDTLEQWQAGKTTVLRTSLQDQYGVFHDIGSAGAFNTYMAVDPAGRYLYASLITDSSVATDTTVVFRLIKIDLHSYAIQTLNRTTFPANSSDIDAAYVASLQMTGPLASVFLPPLSQIFPAANGTIYFVTEGVSPNFFSYPVTPPLTTITPCQYPVYSQPSAVGKIDAATGTVTYLVKSGCTSPMTGLPIAGASGYVDLLPNLTTTPAQPWNWIDAIDADSGVVYASAGGAGGGGNPGQGQGWTKVMYSLGRAQPVNAFAPNINTFTNSSGPFSTVDGAFGVLGVVSGKGRRVWAQRANPNNGSTLSVIEVLDFDRGFVSPYVEATNLVGFLTDAFGVFGNAAPIPVLLNRTANGDPLLAIQAGGGGLSTPPPAYVLVPASTGAQAARHHASHRLR